MEICKHLLLLMFRELVIILRISFDSRRQDLSQAKSLAPYRCFGTRDGFHPINIRTAKSKTNQILDRCVTQCFRI